MGDPDLLDRPRPCRVDLRKYAGHYTSRRKFPTESGSYEEDALTITVHRNVLKVRFVEQPNREIHGESVMDRQLPTTGRGQYDHKKDVEQLWGFWDIQVKDDNAILVHTSYASTNDTLTLQGYIWKRITRRPS